MKKIVFICMCVLFTAGIALADWNEGDGHKMHYPQLPKEGGWDVSFDPAVRLADDWQCSQTGPVEDVHFWVSWEDDMVQTIDGFTVRIWSDNPSGQNGYSEPNELLWERDLDIDDFTVRNMPDDLQGWFNPFAWDWILNDHVIWQQVNIVDIADPLIQEEGKIYWLEIDMWGAPNCGWKESGSPHFRDDAVGWWSSQWNELIDPETGESMDLAFVITGEEEEVVKWSQPPCLDDPFLCMDVDATDDNWWWWAPQALADDFLCTATGTITDIRIWSSWLYDELPSYDPSHVWFTLCIYSNNPQGPMGWSEPNELLWMKEFHQGQFDVEIFAEGPEAYYIPCQPEYMPDADFTCWLYSFYIDPYEAFVQEEGTIYWLALQAHIYDPDPMFEQRFGWKNSSEQWNDDAVWTVGNLPFDHGQWEELRHPMTMESVDLAFEITTIKEEVEPKEPMKHLKWSQPPIEIDPDVNEPPVYCGWDELSYLLDYTGSTLVYQNWDASGIDLSFSPGASGYISIADDMTLAGTERKLDHYDFRVYAYDGTAPYTVTSELYTEVIDPCTGYEIPGSPIPGTLCNHNVGFDGYVTLDCAPGSGAILPDYVWMVLSFDTVDASWCIAEEAEVGFTADAFALDDGTGWGPFWFGGDPYAGFDANIWCESEQQQGQMVADDFRCLGAMPVTSMHWWGSHFGWEEPGAAPPQQPVAWQIGFWSNNPGAAGADFSYPEELLWQIEVPADRVEVDEVGTDEYIGYPYDICYQYTLFLETEEYFWQQEFLEDTNDDIFWLSIAAIYDPDVDLQFPWGWKTRPEPWMDDAVSIYYDGPINPGTVITPDIVTPIEDPSGQSMDVAFELDTDPNYIKWEQPFTGIRDWPHYWDELSMAIEDTPGEPNIIRLVADDWLCERRTPVTALSFWGSYIDYYYEACQETQMPMPVKPDYFDLRIWTDIPVDPCAPGSFSHPDDIIWEYKAYDYDEVLVGFDKFPEGEAGPREAVFRYSVRLPEENWFQQRDFNEVFWLSVNAAYEDAIADYDWGWTNHEHVFNDNAVEGVISADESWQWQELYDQTGMSEDMSFILFTDPNECVSCADYNSDGIVDFVDYADFADDWLWSGPTGGYNNSDLNCDGIADANDLGIFTEQWLKSCP